MPASTLHQPTFTYNLGNCTLPASIFLSYASEDREAARSIGDSLAKLGIEVWMDESELGGGDAWDQKIRKQIRECDYFMPIVSARTEARHEGYFRREWRLAVERTLDMADDHLFLLPVVIDDTDQARARVPEKFLAVQWLRAPEGRPTPALEALCRRILNGDPAPVESAKNKPARRDPGAVPKRPLAAPYPPFPREEPGQRVRFWAHVLGWLGQSRMGGAPAPPSVATNSHLCLGGDRRNVARVHPGVARTRDLAFGCQEAQSHRRRVPGQRPSGGHCQARRANRERILRQRRGHRRTPRRARDTLRGARGRSRGGKLADAAFAQTFGRLSVTHRGEVGLDKDSLSSNDLSEAFSRARAGHSAYVVYGSVGSQGSGAGTVGHRRESRRRLGRLDSVVSGRDR